MAKTTAFRTVPQLPIRIEGGILYSFDAHRNLFLSTSRKTLLAGRQNRAKNTYLRLIDSQASNLAGYRMSTKCAITTVSAQSRGTNVWQIHIRKNNEETNLYTLTVSDGGSHDNNVDVRLDAGDTVQFYCEANSFFGIQSPIVWVEVATRL